MVGPIVYVINRTTRTLVVTKNAKHYPIPPGRQPVNSDLVPFAMRQHPVPGTRDRLNPYLFQSMIVPADNPRYDTSPLDDETLSMLGDEVLDITSLPLAEQKARQQIRAPHPIRGGRHIGMEDVTRGVVDPGKLGGLPD